MRTRRWSREENKMEELGRGQDGGARTRTRWQSQDEDKTAEPRQGQDGGVETRTRWQSQGRGQDNGAKMRTRQQSQGQEVNRVYCSASKMDDTLSHWSDSRSLGAVHFGPPFTLFLYIASHPFFVLLSNWLSTSTGVLHLGRLSNLPHTPRQLHQVYCCCSTATLPKVCDKEKNRLYWIASFSILFSSMAG